MDSRRFTFIEKAISFEEGAIAFYDEIAERMKNEGYTNAWQMAVTMREEERRHKQMLRDLGSQDLSELQRKAERLGAYDIEGVEKLSFPLKEHKTEEVLKEAVEREKTSIRIYSQLKEAADSDELRDFFESMRQEEEKHLEMVTDQYDKLRLYDRE